jgi:hypothetical protein
MRSQSSSETSGLAIMTNPSIRQPGF